MGKDWRVVIHQTGRGGTIHYSEPAGALKFDREFGGGDTVAIVFLGGEAGWASAYPWTSGRWKEIVQRVSDEVIRQKAASCRAYMDEAGTCLLIQSGSPE